MFFILSTTLESFDDTSDHFPIVCSVTFPKPINNNFVQNTFSERFLKVFRQKYMGTSNLEMIDNPANPDIIYNHLVNRVNQALNQAKATISVTNSQTNRNKNSLPWYDYTIKLASKTKNDFYKKFISKKLHTDQQNDPELLEAHSRYKNYKNKLNSVIRKARRQYIFKSLEKAKNDARKTWSILNSLIINKSQPSSTITSIVDPRGIELFEPVKQANCFNNFFTQIGHTLASNIPTPCNKTFNQFLNPPYAESFFLSPATPDEVGRVFRECSNSNALDINSHSQKLFTSIYDLMKYDIAQLYNTSVSMGIFPTCMKLAKVIPIYKKGRKDHLANYRPIAILPFLSKIIEKLVNKRLLNFLIEHSLINSSQYGFLPGRSTIHAAMEYYEIIAQGFSDNKSTISISLDLSKAFDTINVDILLTKLSHIGIRGTALDWFRSYATSRRQCVAVAGVLSSEEPISCGVPQGSVLGPTLFLIYINDIINSSSHFKFIQYADDTTLIFQTNKTACPKTQQNLVNIELGKIVTWLHCNKLSLNVSKTQVIGYNLAFPRNAYQIAINNEPLSFVSNINFLGIHFNESLKWDTHILHIKSKISKITGLLHRQKKFLPKRSLLLLYNSLIHCHLTYGTELWGASPMSALCNIKKIQKSAIRAIMNAQPRTHTASLFAELKILPVNKIYENSLGTQMYKAFHNLLPPNLQLLYTRPFARTTRQSGTNLTTKLKSTKLQNSRPSVSGPHFWNSIPANIKPFSLATFKRKLKLHLISQ